MIKFEYNVLYQVPDPTLPHRLNELGNDGWELVQIIRGTYVSDLIMKRRKSDPVQLNG